MFPKKGKLQLHHASNTLAPLPFQTSKDHGRLPLQDPCHRFSSSVQARLGSTLALGGLTLTEPHKGTCVPKINGAKVYVYIISDPFSRWMFSALFYSMLLSCVFLHL